MLHTRKKFLAMTFATATAMTMAFTATSASAASRHDISKVATVLDNLAQGSEKARHGQQFAAKRAIRTSYYQLRSVIWNLERSRGNRTALEALNVAVEKLNDRYLSTDEQLYFGIDCVSIALENLVKDHVYGRDGVALLLKAADAAGQGFAFERASSLLYAADAKLRREMCPIRGRQVLEAIAVAMEKAQDPYLTTEEKAYFIDDCVRVALRNL